MIDTVRNFQYNADTVWEIKATALLEDLQTAKAKLFKLKEKDKSDEKYILAEKITRVSKEYDKLGGNERIAGLIDQYFHGKDAVLQVINMADFEREELKKQFSKIEQSEAAFIHSKNVSVVENKFKQLNDLHWKALSNTTSFLISLFIEYKSYDADAFKDYNAAKSIIKMADAALEKERYPEFRRHVFAISNLIKVAKLNNNSDFKGTGIG
ncbi:MAG: hypothetical protein WDM90_05260 [Ferruginibacter sp.]